MKHELQQMRNQRSGAIVNCSSLGGLVGGDGRATYHATKHGVIGQTKSVALQYGKYGGQGERRLPRNHRDPDGRPHGGARRAGPRERRRQACPSAASGDRTRSPPPCCGCAATPPATSPARRCPSMPATPPSDRPDRTCPRRLTRDDHPTPPTSPCVSIRAPRCAGPPP